MYTGFVRKSVTPDDCFIRLYLNACYLGQKLTAGKNLLRVNTYRVRKQIRSDFQNHHEFLKRCIACPLADSIDGAFNLTSARTNSSYRICNSQSKIIVAMNADHHPIYIFDATPDLPDQLGVF